MLTGVYVDARTTVDLDLRAAALALVVPPEAVVVDRTAAWLHGLDLLRRSAINEAPPVQMYLAKDSRIRRSGVDSGRRGMLARDVTELHGIRVTTPMRTCLDLARLVWRFDALGAIDQFLRLGATHEELLVELSRFRGYRGVRQARALIPLGDERAESMAESALRLHWHDAVLPWPEPQYWVHDAHGIGIYRLDLTDPVVQYCAEFDGELFHTEPADRQHDDERRKWCRELGWEIDVLTKASVYGLNPDPQAILAAGWERARRARRRIA